MGRLTRHASLVRRHAPEGLAAAALFLPYLALGDFELAQIPVYLASLALVLVFALVHARTRRPLRSYALTGLSSLTLLGFLIFAAWHGAFILALVFWLGVTAIAFAIVRVYEGPSPRPD